MGPAKTAAIAVRDIVRYLTTGRTTSRRDRAALTDYQTYRAREQARERHDERS